MIVDAHCHLGRSPQFHFPDVSVRTMLAIMDRLSIERTVCCHLAMLQGAWELGFEESIAAFRESAGRVTFYATFDPTLTDGLALVTRCLDREEFVGVKILILRSTDATLMTNATTSSGNAWQLGDTSPFSTHSWDISAQNPREVLVPESFRDVSARYPEVTLILGHAGARY